MIDYNFKASKIVYIRQKASVVNREGVDPAERNKYIGSSYKNQDTLRGLDFTEEKRFLVDIVGIDPNSTDWAKATKAYWANIRVRIPYGNIGKELQIGFQYETEDKLRKGEVGDDFLNKQKFGEPINVSDYILYRYCLLYSKVANNINDVNNSPKIDFYLYSKDAELADKAIAQNTKVEAMKQYLSVLGDRQLVDDILTLYNQTPESLKDKEKDILLDEYVSSDPKTFLVISADPAIKMKSLIERAIKKGILRRIDNTDTIIFGDNINLGQSLNDAVANLNSVRHNNTLVEIKARLKHNDTLNAPIDTEFLRKTDKPTFAPDAPLIPEIPNI